MYWHRSRSWRPYVDATSLAQTTRSESSTTKFPDFWVLAQSFAPKHAPNCPWISQDFFCIVSWETETPKHSRSNSLSFSMIHPDVDLLDVWVSHGFLEWHHAWWQCHCERWDSSPLLAPCKEAIKSEAENSFNWSCLVPFLSPSLLASVSCLLCLPPVSVVTSPAVPTTCVSYLLALWPLACASKFLQGAQALKKWVGLPMSWFFSLLWTKMFLNTLCWHQQFQRHCHDGIYLPCHS